MKNNFLFLVFLIILAVFAVNGLSCRQGTQEKKQLSLWLVGFKEKNFSREIRAFEKSQKAEVETKEIEKQDLEEKLLNAMAVRQGPDVVMIDNDFLAKHKDIFIPCVKQIKKDKALFCDINILKNNYAPIVQSLVWDEKAYGYPYRVSTPILIYNKKMFSEIRQELQISEMPYWWDDFVRIARALTKKDNQGKIVRAGVALGTAQNNPIATDILYSLMLQNGTNVSTQQTPPLATFHLPVSGEMGNLIYPGVKALEFYSSFSYERSENYSFNLSYEQAWKAFAKEKVAMIFDYPERMDDIRYLAPNLQIGGAIMPQITDTENPTVYGKVYAFGITRDAQDPVLAWELARELARRFEQTYVAKQKKETDWRRAKGLSSIWETQVNFAQTIYKDRYPEEFDKYVKEMIDSVAKRQIKPKSGIERTAQQINQLIIKKE